MMTRANFLTEYEKELKIRYDWAGNREKLEKIMKKCNVTLSSATIDIHGAACGAAWHAIGGKGKPTYKALQDLPLN